MRRIYITDLSESHKKGVEEATTTLLLLVFWVFVWRQEKQKISPALSFKPKNTIVKTLEVRGRGGGEPHLEDICRSQCWNLDNGLYHVSTERSSRSPPCWLVLIVTHSETSVTAVTTWGLDNCGSDKKDAIRRRGGREEEEEDEEEGERGLIISWISKLVRSRLEW